MRNIFKNNEIKFVKEEEKGAKLPSKMSKKALLSALKGDDGINSGMLKNIQIQNNEVIFLIKKGNSLLPGKFPLAQNKVQWEIIEDFLTNHKVNQKIISIIKEEGIKNSLSKRLIRIG